MRPALTVFVSWGKLRPPRFPKEEREQCAPWAVHARSVPKGLHGCLLLSRQRGDVTGDPCGSMGNGAEARVLGVLKAILAFP